MKIGYFRTRNSKFDISNPFIHEFSYITITISRTFLKGKSHV